MRCLAHLRFDQLKHTSPHRAHILLHLPRPRTWHRCARMRRGSSGDGAQDLVHHQLQRCRSLPGACPCG